MPDIDIIIPIIVVIFIFAFIYLNGRFDMNPRPIPELLIIPIQPTDPTDQNLRLTYQILATYTEIKNSVALGAELPNGAIITTDDQIRAYCIDRNFNILNQNGNYVAIFDDRKLWPSALPWSSRYTSAYDQNLSVANIIQ